MLLNTHEIICYNDNYLNWKDVCCHRNAHGKKRYETTAMITGLTLNGETASYRRKVK